MLYEAYLTDSASYRTMDPKPSVRVLVRADSLGTAAKKVDAYRDESCPGRDVTGLGEVKDLVLID